MLTVAVSPISSESVETFFSTVNKGMIPTKKSMTVVRLNDLCVLFVDHDLTLRYSWKRRKVSVSQIIGSPRTIILVITPSVPVKCLCFSVTAHYNLTWANRFYQ